MLIKYVKNRKRGKLIGVVVAVGPGMVGWSKCNYNAGDVFDKDFGIMIAEGRASVGSKVEVPNALRSDIAQMCDRSLRYYKAD